MYGSLGTGARPGVMYESSEMGVDIEETGPQASLELVDEEEGAQATPELLDEEAGPQATPELVDEEAGSLATPELLISDMARLGFVLCASHRVAKDTPVHVKRLIRARPLPYFSKKN